MVEPSGQPPLTSPEELASASAARLRAQLHYEFRRAYQTSAPRPRQLAFAIALGYDQASHVSGMLSGSEPVTRGVAEALDARHVLTTLGIPFTALQDALAGAQHRERAITRGSSTALQESVTDVFLSSPMASLDSRQAYDQQREDAKTLAAEIRAQCNLTVYYAGRDISNQTEFDDEAVAVQDNVAALLDSRYFVLLVTRPLQTPSTSVLVEAGMALAYGKPSIYFVSDLSFLPYILRRIGDGSLRTSMPSVSIEICAEDGVRRAVGLVRRHGRKLFSQLDRS
jgi:hypothetical protein